MSYFLEDTFSTSSSDVVVDYTGINEALFNSEIAWSNIMESAMKNEYQAIKNEDSIALQEGISDVFEAIKDWFKKMIQSITRVLANIKNKILVKTNYYGKWALSMAKKLPHAQKKIDKVRKQTTRKITTYEKINDTKLRGLINNFTGVITKAQSTANHIDDKSDYEEKMKDLNEDYMNAKKALEEMKVSKKSVSVTEAYKNWNENNVKAELDYIKGCSDAVKKCMTAFNGAIKVCKIGIRYADKENKDEAIAQKYRAQYINQYSSRYLNIRMSFISIAKAEVSNKLMPLIKSASDNDFEKKYAKAGENILKASYNGF